MEEICLTVLFFVGSALFTILRRWYLEKPQAAFGVLSSYTAAILVVVISVFAEQAPGTFAESLEAILTAANRMSPLFLLVSIPFFVLLGWGAGIIGWKFGRRIAERNTILQLLTAGIGGFIVGLLLGLFAANVLALFS